MKYFIIAQQFWKEALILHKMLNGWCDTLPPLTGPVALGMKEVHTLDKGFVSLPLAEDQVKAVQRQSLSPGLDFSFL